MELNYQAGGWINRGNVQPVVFYINLFFITELYYGKHSKKPRDAGKQAPPLSKNNKNQELRFHLCTKLRTERRSLVSLLWRR